MFKKIITLIICTVFVFQCGGLLLANEKAEERNTPEKIAEGEKEVVKEEEKGKEVEKKAGDVVAVTNEDFKQIVIQSEAPVLVDFFADWSGPCKTQTPILYELSKEFDGRIKFAKVDIDVDGNKELATKYGVLSVPTLILFSNGEVKDTMVGVTSKKKLEQKLEQVL